MSMLARYKKAGGFLQLLNLLETTGSEKREKFLKIIEEEDARWAEALKQKMLSIKRIFSWDDNAVAEVISRLNDLSVGVLLHGLDDGQREKALKMLSHSQKRKIEEIYSTKKPTQQEITTIFMQVLTEVRKNIAEGYIHLDKIDPELVVDDEIEEKLNSSTLYVMDQSKAGGDEEAPFIPASPTGQTVALSEYESLKKRYLAVSTENKQLKDKLANVESRLNQVRRAVA